MEKPKIRTQIIAGFTANMAVLCAGTHFGWAAPSLPKLLSDNSDIPITSNEGSWIVSSLTLGSAFGPFVTTLLVDKWGRKWTILLAVVPYLGSAVLLAAAHNFWWLALARFIAGLGCGISLSALPIYLGEIADDRIRGALSSMIVNQLFAGFLVSLCVGPWVSSVVFACTGGALAMLFGLMFVWMPETPYFLIMKQEFNKAKKSLSYYRGRNDVVEELNKIKVNVEIDQKNAGTIKELVMIPGNRKALIIASGLIVAQQFNGIVVIIAYMTLIFEASGSTLDSNSSAIVIIVIQILSGMVATFTTDLVGRKPLLMLSVCGTTIFHAGEAMFFQLQAIGSDVSSITWLPVACTVGFMIMHTIGLGCIPYVMISELFSCNIKALASTFVAVTGALFGIISIKLYQGVADSFGIHSAFWGFSLITIFSGILIYFFVPETKRRSLRDIQDELHQSVAISDGRTYVSVNK